MNSPLLNYTVLGALLVTTALGWTWPWGVLFIFAVIPAFIAGEAHLVGTIERAKSPVLFWLVTLLWAVFGALMILQDVAPDFANTYLK